MGALEFAGIVGITVVKEEVLRGRLSEPIVMVTPFRGPLEDSLLT